MRLNVPYLDHREIEEIAKVLSTGYLTQGPKTVEFERLVAEYVGCRHAFAMSSCTTALHLSLVALGVERNDEVLVADFTFPATANVVVHQGAVPVMVDINLDTFTIDPLDMERKITPRTKAIMPVDTFGCAADMDAIMTIADKHGIPVIEDAACAIGTTYKKRFCGNLSTIGCFSFHPRKVITTGEGGMLMTNDDAIAEKVKLLRAHGGHSIGRWYEYDAAGYNYRLSDILAAVGIAQMEKLPTILKTKRHHAAGLSDRLSGIKGLRPPINPSWGGHAYQSYVIFLDEGVDRNAFMASLKSSDIECTLGTYALHAEPVFQAKYGYVSGQLPNSYAAFTRAVTLPLYVQMTEADLDTIATAVRKAMAKG